jgi:cobalt-zinc-cadmium efflux system outer membrane protein
MHAYRWIWCTLLLLASCAVYEDRSLSPAEALDDFESRTLDAEPLTEYLRANLKTDRAPKAWGLAEFTLAAFYYNPQLDIARAQWAVARGRETTAAERPNPTFALTPGFNSTTGYGADISPWIVDVALDIPIETAGKRGYRITEARYVSESARLHIAQAAWEVRRQVREALLDLYAAGRTEALMDRRRTLQTDNVKLLEQLFEIGEISANELGQARIQRDQTNLAWLDAGKHLALARARLAAAVGVPARALEAVQLSFDALERLPDDVPPAEARRQALLHREDLLAALSDYQASQTALQQAIAGQYPDIQLGPGYEFDQSEDKWMVGFSVSLPVFHRNRGAIATAEAQREEAAATFRDVQARIVSQIERAVMDYRASAGKVRAVEDVATQRTGLVDRVRKMYEAGEVLMLEVTSAELELNAGSANLLDARIEMLQAFGQLEDAMHVAADLPGSGRRIPVQSREQGDQDHEQ